MKLICSIMLLLCAVTAHAQQVSAELLADHKTVTPGQTFTVGVRLQLQPQWHVYWKYPGDAGLATRVRWTVPEGFSGSDLLWPVPQRFMQEGNIEGYGYEREVLLMTQLTAPADATGQAEIVADVRWLVCKEVCVPGKTQVRATVQVGQTPEPANQQLFATWKARLPKPATDLRIEQQGMSYRLLLDRAGASNADVFVAPAEGLKIVTRKASVERGSLVGLIKLEPLPGEKAPGKPGEAVLTWTDSGGARQAASVTLPRP